MGNGGQRHKPNRRGLTTGTWVIVIRCPHGGNPLPFRESGNRTVHLVRFIGGCFLVVRRASRRNTSSMDPRRPSSHSRVRDTCAGSRRSAPATTGVRRNEYMITNCASCSETLPRSDYASTKASRGILSTLSWRIRLPALGPWPFLRPRSLRMRSAPSRSSPIRRHGQTPGDLPSR